jgi:hypothetical protein
MAQADQMRQVEVTLEKQLNACTLDANQPTDRTNAFVSETITHPSIDIMADTRDDRRSATFNSFTG